ncbi:MAG: Glyoxalase/Bleomycin resistance protein/Dioxygenase superfamily [Clostridiales bacterium]|nr:Glyoxalase/Bleomycin resistance protein/Dioxygenase superfamily [Clostridiales bacterium]
MSNKSHTNGNKGKSSMELIAMNHMHGWMDDPGALCSVFRDILGLSCEERDLTPYLGMPLLSTITRKEWDSVWVEYFQELVPGALASITGSRTPGVFAIDYRVKDLDQAQKELKALGITRTLEVPIGSTRQFWYDPEKTFGLFIELSEFEEDDDLIKNMTPLCKPLVTPQGTLGIERLDHVHAWTTDADGGARFYSDVFGMTTHSWIDPNNNIKIALLKAKDDPRYIELFQPLGQDARQNIDSPRNPGIFSVNYKVEDVARATRELEMQGIRKVWSDDRGAVKQAMFASDRTNGLNIELSEYSGNDFIKAAGMDLPA